MGSTKKRERYTNKKINMYKFVWFSVFETLSEFIRHSGPSKLKKLLEYYYLNNL